MLHIDVFSPDKFNNSTQEFISDKLGTLVLEHSLVSLSKWEQIFEKPFINNERKTDKETLEYIKCMNVGTDTPPEVFENLSQSNINDIQNYINAKMTATWFTEEQGHQQSREIITAELIYYWMISLGIPFECQEWHLNRLLTLIQVCNRKNAPKKKMSHAEAAAKMSEMNRLRREQLKTNG